MSERPIAVGDLVQVVRGCPHCGDFTDLGHIFVVDEILNVDTPMTCCQNTALDTCAFPPETGNAKADEGYQLHVLKRIPPPSELESTRTEEKKKVPA